MPADHVIQRVRHELKRRVLEVRRVERLTPRMVRITVSGAELEGFASAGFDDHIKLIVPEPGEARPLMPVLGPNGPEYAEGAKKPAMRDFTPRRYDAEKNELAIDIALHHVGPATVWAEQVTPGQFVGVGGPRGSFVIPMDFDWHLLVGDETALPAIGRRLEELPAETRAIVVAEIDSPEEELTFKTEAAIEIVWVYRGGAEPGSTNGLLKAVRELTFPAGDAYAWIAAESDIAKTIRRYLLEERQLNREWIKAAGYWRKGDTAVHDTHSD